MNATRIVHKEERSYWQTAEITDRMYFNFFHLLASKLYYFPFFHLLNFYFFPRFFNDKPILLVDDDL